MTYHRESHGDFHGIQVDVHPESCTRGVPRNASFVRPPLSITRGVPRNASHVHPPFSITSVVTVGAHHSPHLTSTSSISFLCVQRSIKITLRPERVSRPAQSARDSKYSKGPPPSSPRILVESRNSTTHTPILSKWKLRPWCARASGRRGRLWSGSPCECT